MRHEAPLDSGLAGFLTFIGVVTCHLPSLVYHKGMETNREEAMNTSIEPIRTYAGVAVYSVCDVLDESLPNWTGGAHWSPQGQYDAIRAWCKRNDAEFYETSAEYFNWRAAVGQAHESGKAAVVISNLS